MDIGDIIGKIPDVPFKVTVEDSTIMRISVASIMVAVIVMLIGTLLHAKK
jgi:hypothetical protein